MPLPRPMDVTHEDLAELIEKEFRKLNNRLDDIEARLGR